jgi:hypothetical protein
METLIALNLQRQVKQILRHHLKKRMKLYNYMGHIEQTVIDRYSQRLGVLREQRLYLFGLFLTRRLHRRHRPLHYSSKIHCLVQ